MNTPQILTWIGEQLDLDAAHAEKDLWAADRCTPGHWHPRYGVNLRKSFLLAVAGPGEACAVATVESAQHEADLFHLTRHQPDTARVRAREQLAGIAGVRAILAEHPLEWHVPRNAPDDYVPALYCPPCHAPDGIIYGDGRPCLTLLGVAARWAGRDGYQPEWAL